MTKIAKLFEQYFEIEEKVGEYFGLGGVYHQFDWHKDDYWALNGDEVQWDEENWLKGKEGTIDENDLDSLEPTYASEIVRQGIYRKEDYTLIVTDNGCGDIFYSIFDNSKELKYKD